MKKTYLTVLITFIYCSQSYSRINMPDITPKVDPVKVIKDTGKSVDLGKVGGKLGLKIGGFFAKEVSKIILRELLDSSGALEYLFGEKSDKVEARITREQLTDIKNTLDTVSQNLVRQQDEIMAGLATLSIDQQRMKLNSKMMKLSAIMDGSDMSPSLVGYYVSENISSASKMAHGKNFVTENSHVTIRNDIESLHSLYVENGYFQKLARAYLYTAASSPEINKTLKTFDQFEDEYSQLMMYEINLLVIYVLNRTITQKVGTAEEAEQAKLDLQHFLPKWKSQAKQHQRAYLASVAMLAGALGSQLEGNTWVNNEISPLSIFAYEIRDAGRVSNDFLTVIDPSEDKLHYFTLVREVDLPFFEADRYTHATYAPDCPNDEDDSCITGIFPKKNISKATVDKIRIESPSKYGYLQEVNSRVHLFQSGKWVLIDVAYNNKRDSEFFGSVMEARFKNRVEKFTCIQKATEGSCYGPVDARYMGPSQMDLRKIPLELNDSRYQTTWWNSNKEINSSAIKLKNKAIAGRTSTAGADHFGKLKIRFDQPFNGKIFGRVAAATHLAGINPQGSKNFLNNSCAISYSAASRVTLNHKIKLGSLEILNGLTSPKDLPCSKDNSFQTTAITDEDGAFNEFKNLATLDEVRQWSAFNLNGNFESGEHELFFQVGHNTTKKVWEIGEFQDPYIDVSLGLSNLFFYSPGKIGP